MKAEFERWYEAVKLTPDPDVTEKRWAAVQAQAGVVSDAEMEALVRAAFRSDQTVPVTGAVRSKLAEKGDAVGDEEFALLAGATLCVILQQSTPAAARAATMIGTAHFEGLRTVRQPMDLVGLAASTRLTLAQTTRRRPPLQLAPMSPLEIDMTKALEADDCDESIRMLAEELTSVMKQLVERQSDFEQRVRRYVSTQDEELDMLWWLQGGRTKSGHLFKEIPREQQPFVLARDLAEATFALPAAPSTRALLERAGIEDDAPMEIAAAIQGLPIEFLKTSLPEADKHRTSPVTTPLLEGFRRRIEVRGENTWIAGWAGVCDIDKGACLRPLQLANLWYCEQLLIHK